MKNDYPNILKKLKQALARTFVDKQKIFVPKETKLRQRIPGTEFHVYPELFVQLSGANEFTFPESKVVMKTDDMMMLPALLSHREEQQTKETFKHFVVMFFPHVLQLHFSDDRFFPQNIRLYNYQNEKLIKGAVQAFTDKSITQKNASSASIQSLQAYILSYLIETLEQNTPKHDLGNAKVEQVKKLIRTMYSNPSLSIPKLASLVECNPDYLSNLYSTETGEHLSVYIRRIRLEAAKQQLRTTNLTISEIAWACGFENPSYFSNQYKKYYHHTPREEREIPERHITPK